jgi:hypothetical protein
MLERTEVRFDLKPKRPIADTALWHWPLPRLAGEGEADHAAHPRLGQEPARRRHLLARRLRVRQEPEPLRLPGRKHADDNGAANKEDGIRYVASITDCRVCPLKSKCCPNMKGRQITRDIDEDARDVARRKMKTKAFLRSRDQRKRVEIRFGHLKTHHGFERMRLRGLTGARDEFHMRMSRLAASPLPNETVVRSFAAAIAFFRFCTSAPSSM